MCWYRISLHKLDLLLLLLCLQRRNRSSGVLYLHHFVYVSVQYGVTHAYCNHLTFSVAQLKRFRKMQNTLRQFRRKSEEANKSRVSFPVHGKEDQTFTLKKSFLEGTEPNADRLYVKSASVQITTNFKERLSNISGE